MSPQVDSRVKRVGKGEQAVVGSCGRKYVRKKPINVCMYVNFPGKRLKNQQHPAFPRGPPPQYYLDSILLNFAVRMGSGDPG